MVTATALYAYYLLSLQLMATRFTYVGNKVLQVAFPPTRPRPTSWTLPGVAIYGDLKLRAGGAPVGLGSSQGHGGSGWGVGCAWGSPLPAVVRVWAPGGAAGTWRRFPARPGAFSFPPLLPPSAPAFWGGGRGSRARGGGGGTQAANPLHQPLISRAPRGSEAICWCRGAGIGPAGR